MKLLNNLYLLNFIVVVSYMSLSVHMYLMNIVHVQFIIGTGHIAKNRLYCSYHMISDVIR